MFTLSAQVLGNTHTTSAQRDALGGITVTTAAGPVRVGGVNEAIRVAHRDIGEFLLPAQRGGAPWGLHVEVAGVAAVYGDWPRFSGRPDGKPDTSLVTRIHSRWHDSGPLSALENTLEIIRAYLGTRGRVAA